MGLAAAEQHAVGHDHRRTATGFEQAQEQGQKQQLGLFGLHRLQQVFGHVLVVQAARKRRVGQHQAVAAFFCAVLLAQRVAVGDGGVVHAVQHHVHAADAQHGVVEVVAMEHAMVEVQVQLGVVEQRGVRVAQVFARRNEEAAGARGRVANGVGRRGGGHFHHQLDDVARGTELAVLPGAGDFAQHVFVEVALGVAVVHGHGVQQVHHLGQQRGRGDGEAGVFHVVGIRRIVAAQGAQEGEDMFAHDGKHFTGRFVFEAAPAQAVIRPAPWVGAFGEDAALDGALQAGGLVFFQGVQVVQAAQKEQVGDLLDDFDGVGDAAGPEGIPDLVDFAFEVAGEHVF